MLIASGTNACSSAGPARSRVKVSPAASMMSRRSPSWVSHTLPLWQTTEWPSPSRNSNPKRWYGPAGVPNDLPAQYLGNIISDRVPFNRLASAGPALSEPEIDAIVAFLHTLGDGYSAPGTLVPPKANAA